MKIKKLKKYISLLIIIIFTISFSNINVLASEKVLEKNNKVKEYLLNNYSSIDSNKDRKISKSEFSSYFRDHYIYYLKYQIEDYEEIMDFIANDFTMNKGENLYEFISNLKDVFDNIEITTENPEILRIEQYNSKFIAKALGTATVKIKYGNIERSFKVNVQGATANQPLGEITEKDSVLYRNGRYGYISSNGEFWKIPNKEKPKKLFDNIKKYVAGYVYLAKDLYVGNKVYTNHYKEEKNLALDKNNTLWSWGKDDDSEDSIEKEIGNVKNFDSRYALTNNNELWEYVLDNKKVIDNVKDWYSVNFCDIRDGEWLGSNLGTLVSEIDNRLVVLKNDNTIWAIKDNEIGRTNKNFVKLAQDVKEIIKSSVAKKGMLIGFIKNNGEYYTIDKNLKCAKVADNVSKVLDGIIIKKDGTTWSADGKNKLLNTEVSEVRKYYIYDCERYYLADNNNLWFIANSEISSLKKISENFKKFCYTNSPDFTRFLQIDGTKYYCRFNSVYEENSHVKIKNGAFYLNDVRLLNDVVDYISNYPRYLVIRKDGSIWSINYDGGIPKKIIGTSTSTSTTKPIISSFTASKASPQVAGTEIVLTAKATGNGTLKYRFRVGTGSGNSSTIKDYSTTNTATWKANYAGNKILYVDVKDSTGKVVTKTMTFVVSEKAVAPTISSFTTNKTSPQEKGTQVVLTVKATGTGTLQYRFRVGTANGNSSHIKDYSTSNTATWNANYAGTKVLFVDVKDGNGKVVTKTMNFVVSEKVVAPTISSFTASKASPQVVGTQVVLTAKATGTGTLQYRFRVGTANGNSSLIKDYSTSNTATWNANYAGTKVLYVDVKDSNGKVTTKTITYVIEDNSSVKISSLQTSKYSPQTVGTSIALLTNAEGKGTLNYKYSIYNGTTWTVLQNYSTSDVAIWTPSKAGTYNIKVEVKDSTGTVKSKTVSYVIK